MTVYEADFKKQTVIITGAAQGIGHALSEAFAEAGAYVLMIDLDEPTLAKTAEALGVDFMPADVSVTGDIERVVAYAIERTGQIDVVVNNAGILRDAVLWKLDDEDWEAVIGVHLGGTFRMIRACTPHFRDRSYGRIVNVTSYTGLHGSFGQAAYAAAKAGIIGLTKTAAKELGGYGVTVNAISPNARTRMVESMPEETREEVKKMITLGRFADPSEISAAVLFLASIQAGYITGTVLPVDGGLSM